jgi:hypothetical protein
MAYRWILALTITSMLLGSETSIAQRCSNWQVRRIDRAPEWYLTSESSPENSPEQRSGDSSGRIEYPLDSNLSLVQWWQKRRAVGSDTGNYWIAPGSLYLCGADTILIDSNIYGFGPPTFNRDSSQFAVDRFTALSSEGHRSSIMVFDVVSRSASSLYSWIASCRPAIDSEYGYVAFTDMGDLYVYFDSFFGCELVFRGGGAMQTVLARVTA